ncbi:MAG TPA: Hsp20/alpha crystallin family protein [Candidatus Pacebacteria bacterium]|nr:Hsp20/alpha crystallin family protein [Candidatus Paceibacterota bacterium]HIP33938.1 Hsp20/alpha crystallin family protein [Bacteroidia bacterium]
MTSFLKKLTGGEDNNTHEEDTLLDSNLDYQFDMEDEDAIFDLPIDVYQDNDNMYLRAFIPGVKPESIDLQLTRDIVEISGERSESEKIDSGNYTQRELV